MHGLGPIAGLARAAGIGLDVAPVPAAPLWPDPRRLVQPVDAFLVLPAVLVLGALLAAGRDAVLVQDLAVRILVALPVLGLVAVPVQDDVFALVLGAVPLRDAGLARDAALVLGALLVLVLVTRLGAC